MKRKIEQELRTAARLTYKATNTLAVYDLTYYRLSSALFVAAEKGGLVGASKEYMTEIRQELFAARQEMISGYQKYNNQLNGLATLLGVK